MTLELVAERVTRVQIGTMVHGELDWTIEIRSGVVKGEWGIGCLCKNSLLWHDLI